MKPVALLLLASAALAADAGAGSGATVDPRLASMSFDDCRGDDGYAAPVRDPAALTGERAEAFARWSAALAAWPPGQDADPQRRTAALLDAAAMHDLGRNAFEGEAARAIFDRLRSSVPHDDLVRCCVRLIDGTDGCATTVQAPELTGIDGAFDASKVRERAQVYAKKLLGRLLGRLPE